MSQSFLGLGVSPTVAGALERLGITTPFPVQSLVLTDALAGRDVIAAAPTGSGKTLAFGIPVVERAEKSNAPRALVLVPTRELAVQVADDLRAIARARNLEVAAIYGGHSIGVQAKRARTAAILVATPGRLQDLLDRRLVNLGSISTLVLDEADRMLDMGFRPQVERILKAVPTQRQTLLFSATLEGAVADLARTYTANPVTINASQPVHAASAEIEHVFVSVTADDKINKLVERIDGASGLSLVFVRTKHGADRLARKLLRSHEIRAAVLHGNMSQNARQRSLEMFESGRAMTLVATDVAARGIDVDDISHVINFDPPQSADDYVHRVGRTGRAGRSGTGVTLVLPEQRHDVATLAKRLGHDSALAAAGLPMSSSASTRQASSTRRRGRRR